MMKFKLLTMFVAAIALAGLALPAEATTVFDLTSEGSAATSGWDGSGNTGTLNEGGVELYANTVGGLLNRDEGGTGADPSLFDYIFDPNRPQITEAFGQAITFSLSDGYAFDAMTISRAGKHAAGQVFAGTFDDLGDLLFEIDKEKNNKVRSFNFDPSVTVFTVIATSGEFAIKNLTASLTGGDEQSIISTPLPAAAWGGMALLGLLGAAHRLRRRQINAA